MVARVQELVGALALLSNSWLRMEGRWAKGLVDDTPFFEPNFVSRTRDAYFSADFVY
jgi:hypothetical protein